VEAAVGAEAEEVAVGEAEAPTAAWAGEAELAAEAMAAAREIRFIPLSAPEGRSSIPG
jgi:hypothetical protein